MKSAQLFIMVFFTCIFSGCIDDVIDEHSRNQLVIWGDPPPGGRVGEPYRFVLGARVENTPFDDSYDFEFEFVDGRLPPGTEFRTFEENDVDYAEVVGIPTEAGAFTFAVEVRSDKLRRQKEEEREEEKDESLSFINTVDHDEGLYTIYILE